MTKYMSSPYIYGEYKHDSTEIILLALTEAEYEDAIGGKYTKCPEGYQYFLEVSIQKGTKVSVVGYQSPTGCFHMEDIRLHGINVIVRQLTQTEQNDVIKAFRAYQLSGVFTKYMATEEERREAEYHGQYEVVGGVVLKDNACCRDRAVLVTRSTRGQRLYSCICACGMWVTTGCATPEGAVLEYVKMCNDYRNCNQERSCYE